MIRISDLTVVEAIDTKFMGDVDLFLDTARVFLGDQEPRLESILHALKERQLARAAELTHSFKSSLSYFHQSAPVELAAQIESRAREGNHEEMAELALRFADQVRRLAGELQDLVASQIEKAS